MASKGLVGAHCSPPLAHRQARHRTGTSLVNRNFDPKGCLCLKNSQQH